ncbi:MFS general substrate transporter [Aspergillus homomorphus CBS 101889]|uniref:MFS general substrate transporter n=1 Tax=Aspergillus homomorphus (strain CBS 101889) TaxID=1450537 RepID=A0A395IC94_ASPHC|nr:MFS general substrate transporter [Aspergillus homomorphus CBS 101889]RAL17651.1 MFS general substrate transporter [Aspergillus homomorphus CBS 101889]
MSAPIYTPSTEYVAREYDISHAQSSLGLVLYVVGYGFGALLFTKRAFFLRFLQGFFASASLTTGGASLGDVYGATSFPCAMSIWAACAYSAPTIGPTIPGFVIPVLGWRFSMWEILIAAAPVFILVFTLPETSATTILYRRARRLRQRDCITLYVTAGEMAQQGVRFPQVVQNSLLIPFRITLSDPAMLFVNIYIMLIYSIYYSFFEVCPIVYGQIYGFNAGEKGCVFIGNTIGTAMAMLILFLYHHFGPPVSLSLFGWTAHPSVHWTIPTIGMLIYPATVCILMQCLFLYISSCYPHYRASLFAASDFKRSCFEAAAILFSRPMYENAGVGPGCSILTGLIVNYCLTNWVPIQCLKARTG